MRNLSTVFLWRTGLWRGMTQTAHLKFQYRDGAVVALVEMAVFESPERCTHAIRYAVAGSDPRTVVADTNAGCRGALASILERSEKPGLLSWLRQNSQPIKNG
jgi:hypothetical protein